MEPIISEVKNLSHDWQSYKQQQVQRVTDIETKLHEIELAMKRPAKPLETHNYNTTSLAVKTAVSEFLRKGDTNLLSSMSQKMLSSTSPTDGGYFLPTETQHLIMQHLHDNSLMRRLCSVQTISTDALELIDDYDQAGAGWSHETGTITDTDTPKIHKRRILVNEVYAQPKATQKLIDDAVIDIEHWLVSKVSASFARLENQAFINGSGVGQPKGILSYPSGKEFGAVEQITTSAKSDVHADDLIRLIYSLPEKFAAKSCLLMNRQLVEKLRLMRTSQGQYLWQPGLAEHSPSTFMGVPIHECNEMPMIQSGKVAAAIADFSEAYLIVDRQGISILRDPYTEKPFVKFYATKRVGGEIKDSRAIKLLKVM